MRHRISGEQAGIKALAVLLLTFSFSLALLIYPPEASSEGMGLHGFLQGNYSFNTGESNPDGGDLKWAEERLELRVEGGGGPVSLFLKGDAFYGHLDGKADVEVREAYLDYPAGVFDLRLGRQIITWGLGDLVFINDAFPKDYEAFFSGRPMEYMKRGVDALKAGLYPGPFSAELVAVPFFEPNNFPSQERFWMFDPMPSVANRVEKEPPSTMENIETALRVYRDLFGYEASIYMYRGFYRQPSMLPDSLGSPTRITLFYPRLLSLGISLQGSALDGVLSIEAGYYASRDDEEGTDPFIPNSTFRFLAGYQRQLWEDFTLSLQYYSEYMRDYSGYKNSLPAGFPVDRRLRDLVSFRMTQFLKYQTLRLSLFSFLSPSHGDYLVNPEVNYKFTDEVWASLGANLFGGWALDEGDGWTQFGSLDDNDNVYLQIRREF